MKFKRNVWLTACQCQTQDCRGTFAVVVDVDAQTNLALTESLRLAVGNRVHTLKPARLAMGNHEEVVKTINRSWRLVPCSSKVRDLRVFSDILAIVTKKMEVAVGTVPQARGGDDADLRQAFLSFRLAESSYRPGRRRMLRSLLASRNSYRELRTVLEEHWRHHWEELLMHSGDTRTCRKESQS